MFSSLGVTELVRRSRSRRMPDRFTILMYHRLHAEHGGPEYIYQGNVGPTVKVFERQMRYLKTHYNVIAFDRLIDCLKEGEPIPPNSVIITFDDGYKDIYTLAFPILKSYGLPATVFLATGHIGTNDLLWYDRIAYIVHHTRKNCITVDGLNLPLMNPQDKLVATERLVQLLSSVSGKMEWPLTAELQDAFNVGFDNCAINFGLSWDEVREMALHDITFGSHTVNHPFLTRVSRETAHAEIMDSKRTIEREIQRPVRVFAYPHGDFNEETLSIVETCGLEAACTCSYGSNNSGANLLALRRRGIDSSDTIPIFKANLAAIFPLRSRILRAIRSSRTSSP